MHHMFSIHLSFISLFFTSFYSKLCSGVPREADAEMFLHISSCHSVGYRSALQVIEVDSGIEWVVDWTQRNRVAVYICFCVRGSIVSFICLLNPLCLLGISIRSPSVEMDLVFCLAKSVFIV